MKPAKVLEHFEIYRACGYKLINVHKRYIAYDVWGENLKLYEVNRDGFTIREAFIDPEDYNHDKVKEAFGLRGKSFNQVLIEERTNV